jgi:acyl-coenzyme A synthetase/AMP-(fatty) acid ligase
MTAPHSSASRPDLSPPLSLPLLTHANCDAVVAWHAGQAVTARQFLAAAQALAARLPAAAHALNLCSDRYHFAVAFAASLLRGQCTLLPGAYAPELIRRLQSQTPDMVCLTDGSAARERLLQLRCPVLRIDARLSSQLATDSMPQIEAEQVVARVFTSGSTGSPIGHDKSWGQLVASVRVGAERLLQSARGWSILGTVPAQHMYGFEVTVLLPLQSGGALSSARPFFPADIAAALAALPRPRALVSTPVHLRALVDSDIDLPALDLLVSATAALPVDLAQQLERRHAAPLLEIYGSTETGQMASRRTVSEHAWSLWPGVELAIDAQGGCQAAGGHLRAPTPLADILAPIGTGRFLLEGRTADLVNIAGKRSSLAYLTQQLTAIPGVIDGVFFVPEDAPASVAGVTRLAAVAVAPELDVARITAALRERIDPVFLPRPLLLVERLPRNDTGKLPQQRLLELTAEAAVAAPELFI